MISWSARTRHPVTSCSTVSVVFIDTSLICIHVSQRRHCTRRPTWETPSPQPSPRGRGSTTPPLTQPASGGRGSTEGQSQRNRRDMRRSAYFLPPTWHVGQYSRADSAKYTEAMGSPHRGQGWPLRRCTLKWPRLSPRATSK